MRLASVTRAYRGLLLDEHWNIGIINEPISIFLDSAAKPEIEWLPPVGRQQFLADPFAIANDQRCHVLCEEFDYRVHKGRIVCVEIRSGRISVVTSAIGFPSIHMSYPYLLEEKGEIYCVPETAQAGEIGLYRAEEFPRRWEKAATLVSNFAGRDNTIFRYGGRWWLLSAYADDYPWYGLFIWYARELRGPWIPHLANPVKLDAISSRPAGTPFRHAGNLYRPAQDCSRTYGGRIVLNRIMRLTPTEFEEQQASVIEPDLKGPYPDGLHTISAWGDMTLVDGKCFKFKTTSALRMALTRRMRETRT